MVYNLKHKSGLGESDHTCITFTLKCYEKIKDHKEVPNYFKADYEIIRERLKVNWISKLDGDFERSYDNFIKVLKSSMEGWIPYYKSAKKRKNIYLTQEAIRKKNLKNKLWRRYTRERTYFNRKKYNHAKNELRSLTRKLREQFEMHIARNIKISPKFFWSYVKSKTKTRAKIPPLKKVDDTEAVTAYDKAETLNIYFSSSFTDERLDDVPSNSETTYLCKYLDTFLITPDMVIEKLKELKPDKSPGPDGWHPMFLKSVADLIAYPLSVLYQKSLNESLVPSQWLQAMVTAIHKTGPKNSYENYRPISITSIIGKLMESIIRDKIVSHMERNNLFSETQHSFVPSRNCITNHLICMEHWTNILDKGYPVDIIYTDFSKAFARVPHQRLLKRMENLGIAGNTLQWIKSFLSDRKQRVRVENEFSSWTSVKSGIPQGSVLGPILFMFINDMPDIVKSMCLLFADDAKIFRSVHHSSDYTELQEDLNELTKWSTRWQLPFNIDKCKSLHMGKNNKKNSHMKWMERN